MIRDLLVKTLKPLMTEDAWQRLRRMDPGSAERDRKRAKRTRSVPPAVVTLKSPAASSPTPRAPEPSLTELARRHGTDKWGTHRYTPHYEFHLAHLRNRKFTLLEIGIGGYARDHAGGASLRMWRDYFPKAQIVGLDIENKSFVDGPRIQTYQGSQTDGPLLRTIMDDCVNALVVIDDGSHQNAHVLTTFAELFPLLPEGGMYVIEDTQTSYLSHYGGSLDQSATTTMNLVKSLMDGLNYEEYTAFDQQPSYTQLHVVGLHVYHNMVFIEKGRNEEGSRYRKAVS